MKKIIGAQLFGYRNYCKTYEELDETLKKISEIGYKAIQVSGLKNLTDGKKIKEIADKYQLEILVTHVSYDEMLNEFERIVQYQKDLNCPVVGIGCYPFDLGQTKNSLEELCKNLNVLCAKFKKEGITLAYHNHAEEFKKVENELILDYIVRNTDIMLILDTFWVVRGGVDLFDYIEKVKDRIVFFHYKDFKVVSEPKRNSSTFAEIGYGNLDFDKIIAKSDETSALNAIVEQDETDRETPFISGKLSYDYLVSKGFN